MAHIDNIVNKDVTASQRNTREAIKILEDKIGKLERSTATVQNLSTIINEGGDLFKHAWTHASQRAGVHNSGTDPITPYEFDWTRSHLWIPSKGTYIPVKIKAHENQSVDCLDIRNDADERFVEVSYDGLVGVNDAALDAQFNVRTGEGPDPTSVPNLIFWFDARTISDDNGGNLTAGVSKISNWNSRMSAHTGTADSSGSKDPGLPTYQERNIWGASAQPCVDCDPHAGTGANGVANVDTKNEIPYEAEGGGGGRDRWFDIFPQEEIENDEDFTVVAVGRTLFDLETQNATNSKIIGTFDPETTGNDVEFVALYTHSNALDPEPVWSKASMRGGGKIQTGISTVMTTDEQEWNGHWQLFIEVMSPVDSPTEGRDANPVWLNGVDKTLGSPGHAAGSKTFNIKQFGGGAVEWFQILCYRRALTSDEITTVQQYFANLYSADPDNLEEDQSPDDFDLDGTVTGRDIMHGQQRDETTVFWVDPDGKIGSKKQPASRLHLLETTTAIKHMRLENNVSDYVDFFVDDDGVLRFYPVGTAETTRVAYKVSEVTSLPSPAVRENEFVLLDRSGDGTPAGMKLYFNMADKDGTYEWVPIVEIGTGSGGFP